MPPTPPTVVDVEPIYLDNAALVVGSKDYAAAASKIECIPQTSTSTFKGMKRGASWSATIVDGWQLTIDFAQDYETADSFSNLCFDFEGEYVEFEFAPVEGGQAWTVVVQLIPGGIGGQGGSHATSSVTLGTQGRPERVIPAGGPSGGGGGGGGA